mmetsp:Transcript_14290/g.24327  ORF Transcript_14290/g.24327 Transcript_14290/m.24327 type:complete len:106 (-) Transcript_14290:676-993(-)
MLKFELENRFDFTLMAAFRSIDRYNVGRIDSINLGTFLRSNGFNPTEMELLAIIRRIDTDGDACIDFNELSEYLRSIGPPMRGTVDPTPTKQSVTKSVRFEQAPN